MEIVTEQIARHHVHNHLIFLEVKDPSTLASYVLLKNYYQELDSVVKENKDWRYLFIVKRTFLRHQKHNGKWNCHYCEKDIFKMNERGHRSFDKSCTTVDHKDPACKCKDKTDSKNFLVSCYKCNNEKGSMSYENFMNKIKHRKNLVVKTAVMYSELAFPPKELEAQLPPRAERYPNAISVSCTLL